MYEIKAYHKQQAKRLGVTIKPSTRKNKKIDVFKDNKKVASIGDTRYNDFISYKESRGLKYAEERRRLYRIRHGRFANNKGTPGYYSYNILW
jgi:hypothetical protein